MDIQKRKINVLILGGTEFIGRSLTLQLANDPNINQVMVNRRNNHWDNIANNLPNVQYYYGDRDYPMEYTKLLLYITEKLDFGKKSTDNKWDLVVDFCAYERKEVKSVIRGLDEVARLFIQISSDSVYDVCDEKQRVLDDKDRIKEESSIRPKDNQKIRKLAKSEDYGHGKLMCEEYLKSHQESWQTPFSYICLRLPDVIGPYDSTHRLWAYLKWLINSKQHPVHLEDEIDSKPISLVYSDDVANLIYSIAIQLQDYDQEKVNSYVKSINGRSFNVCFDEFMSLKEFLTKLAHISGIGANNIKFINENELGKNGKYFQPSVDCGPINANLAKEVFGFKPTQMEKALYETSQFYADVERMHKFAKEHRKASLKYDKIVQYYTELRKASNMSQEPQDKKDAASGQNNKNSSIVDEKYDDPDNKVNYDKSGEFRDIINNLKESDVL